jgi:adenosylhomocysteine nucleosidase
MVIGILGALPQEIALLKKDLDVRFVERIAVREFTAGLLYGQDVVIALSGIGKVASACAATIMLTKYGCSSIVFVGVAGGVSKRVCVGDVVIASELVQHDFDATPLYPTKFHIPSVNRIILECDGGLTSKCVKSANEYLSGDFESEVSIDTRAVFGIDKPIVHRGLILSGDTFIDDRVEMETLLIGARSVLPDSEPLAVEMEGASVAQVCLEFGVPFAVVRVISDSSDENAIIDFVRFVDSVASRFSRGIVKRLFEIL